MDAGIRFEELLEYKERETKRWKEWFAALPEALGGGPMEKERCRASRRNPSRPQTSGTARRYNLHSSIIYCIDNHI